MIGSSDQTIAQSVFVIDGRGDEQRLTPMESIRDALGSSCLDGGVESLKQEEKKMSSYYE